MICWGPLSILRTWFKRRDSRPNLIPSVSSLPVSSGPYHTIHVHPRPATPQPDPPTMTRVPAKMVDESDMYFILDGIFGKGRYEVALERDIYKIEAARRLTSSELRELADGERGRVMGAGEGMDVGDLANGNCHQYTQFRHELNVEEEWDVS
ncbi:hypothetical protein B0T16DRAFT_491285 [Cercophora newfieldiana]|uniref:Uncharacterized protein n=1 Tax=Cercophora newfieldiana TaxID=92897 RepID=A0AA40CRZ1_9PEZI|nr:hypothetical protein B0T16DRAFT_491285 [Cercophora newfieldiana]